MSDFFGALELELRAAGERSPQRRAPAGYAAGALAAAALVAVAVAFAAVVVGGGSERDGAGTDEPPSLKGLDPVGTVIPKGEGEPPRAADSTVVARAFGALIGPWQLERYWGRALKTKTGEVDLGAGPCLMVHLLNPPSHSFKASGNCGPRKIGGRTPGFRVGLAQVPARGKRADGSRVRVRQILIYGRVPERATAVVLTSGSGVRARIPAQPGPDSIPGDFFGFVKRAGLGGVRVNWIGRDGKPGSPGIRLPDPMLRR